jgi:lysozyme family protein
MSAANREVAISKTLQYEGGYTNNPKDPGGPTNWGITIKDARMYWAPNATAEDVKAMPKSVAIDIYRQKYWAKMGCDDRPAGVDFVDFDLGVNSGVGRTASFRKALDPQSLSPVAYVKAHSAKRMSFLQSLRTWSVFGKGWGKRVADVEAFGVRLALGGQGKPVAPALKKEAANAAKKSIGHATAGASTSAGAPTLPDLSGLDVSHTLGRVLFVAGVTILVAYFVWHAIQQGHRANAFAAEAKGNQ